MLIAKKGNKVVRIEDSMKNHYLQEGFTIYKDGKVLEYGKGVGIPMETYQKLVEENARLKKDIQTLEEMLKASKEPVGADADTEVYEKPKKTRTKKK